MENDVNNVPVITEQTDAPAQDVQGVSQSATDTGVSQPATGVENPAGVQQVKQEQSVPYDRFKEVNEKAKLYEQQNSLLMQQLQIRQQQTVQKQEPVFKQVCKELGYTDDYLTQDQIAHANEVVFEKMNEQQTLKNYVASKPDYTSVVGSVNPLTGQLELAAPLQRQMAANPTIAAAILRSPDRAILAYEFASKDPDYQRSLQQTTVTKAAQQAAQSLQTRQMSISSVSGQGTLDKAAQIRSMSDDEFEKYKQEIMSRP